jgi:hypothetical protein
MVRWLLINSAGWSEGWLQQQLQYDLAQAELRRRSLQVRKLTAA